MLSAQKSITTIRNILLGSLACINAYSAAQDGGHYFVDITDEVGLSSDIVGSSIARSCFVDLNNDGWPDVVVDRQQVFLNVPDTENIENNISGRKLVEVTDCGLPVPGRGDVVVFADIDNDGNIDAVLLRSVDANSMGWVDDGRRTIWISGNGDGTFDTNEKNIAAATAATTACIGVSDVDLNGRLDLFIGNWYLIYGVLYDSYNNDLLMQIKWGEEDEETENQENSNGSNDANIYWSWVRQALPCDGEVFSEKYDAAGRPTYGAMIADINNDGRGELLELNYGRRWNRCWYFDSDIDSLTADNPWVDIAPAIHFDGDKITHGRHPVWLQERAKTDPRFDREDEKPFRANGNTFDAAVADIDNDGDFDLFLAEITHGWAGDSADRSRFLFNQLIETGTCDFVYKEELSVDRIPPAPEDPKEAHNWNQGDLFCELADMNNDGFVDLLLSSGDYPDDQRLRLYIQNGADGTFTNVTTDVKLEHDGSQQISLADFNGDGALDILVGQTFNRYPAEMREGRTPSLQIFLNKPPAANHFLTLRLEGDEDSGCNRKALGANVKASINNGSVVMQRQVVGIGGHAGKQNDFIVHFGLGEYETVDKLEIIWPDKEHHTQVMENVGAGRYKLRQNGELEMMTSQ